MDFTLDETRTDLRDLAADLLGKEVTAARLEAHEGSGAPYDAALWRSLARAGLLGACLPEEAGGAGLGAVGTAVLLREIGARVAPVPAEPSLVAAQVIASYGSREQREALAPLAEGEITLAVAPSEPGRDLGAPPVTVARPDGAGWVLDGAKGTAPHAAGASKILLTARTDTGTGVFLVDPGDVEPRPVPVPTGEPAAAFTLRGVPGEMVGAADGLAAGGLRRAVIAGNIAVFSGVLAGALALTTEYIRTRRQFDRALAEFQAVTVQIADVYIAARALDVAVWSGAWRLEQGDDEEAEADLAVGALTATEQALHALYTCQHLHGGIGVDVTYPLHRYFAWGRHHAHLLGGAEARLDTIGALV
ncbi:acyl-CoA dehydrogenase family protein [Streptosporangium longisporum]|uniref:Acyl-CoA dehydrogenase family protein n=1 Tax=Streptosporangium longisporum TaxID=46187 RepID=A0ABN3XXP4_9ACTN